jgi:predicted PurR-regulated permease PerM
MAPLPAHRPPARSLYVASCVLAALGLLAVLHLGLLPSLLAGLLVYELVLAASPLLGRRVSGARARLLVVAIFASIVVGLLVVLILVGANLVQRELTGPGDFWQDQLMPLIERARQQLPQQWVARLPDTVDELRIVALDQLRTHAGTLQVAGVESVRVLVHILIGLVLGAIVSLSQARNPHDARPLAAELTQRCKRLANAFHDIVFAQFKISLVNTVFTAIFLLLVLPLFGVNLPFAKALVVVTFVAGLLPVIGNLISNTVITIAGLSVSLEVGAISLLYLIAIHKLEYFLNARIVAGQIRSSAWELLLAMVLLEAAFGLAGVIAAPIYYAYLKSELQARGLV